MSDHTTTPEAEELAQLRADLDRTRAEREEAERRWSASKDQVDIARAELANLQPRAAGLSRELEEARAEIAAARQTIKELVAARDHLAEELDRALLAPKAALEATGEARDATIEGLEELVRTLTRERDQLRADLVSTRKAGDRACDQLRADLAQVRTERDELRSGSELVAAREARHAQQRESAEYRRRVGCALRMIDLAVRYGDEASLNVDDLAHLVGNLVTYWTDDLGVG